MSWVVHIAGAPFAHRLYQFGFAHSGWRHARAVCGGESFQALSSGLQEALWMAGGVPEEHRTDSLSAAFNNLAEHEELTRRYEGLCQHYGMRASRNNPGQTHKNGPIESRQGSLKRVLDQALLLRGSREFADLGAYEQFVAETVRRLNTRCARAWEVERARLKALPVRRTVDFEEIDARVSKFGTFSAKCALYSVPSRLAGHRLKVRLYNAHLEAWLGGVKVFECERLYATTRDRHPKRIDWRHMLPSLKRKPGALARWVLRDAMFPRSEYARAWQHLRERLDERSACRLMVDLLDLAEQANVVAELAGVLTELMEENKLPDIEALRGRFAPRSPLMPSVQRGGRVFSDTKSDLLKWMNCSIVTAAMPVLRSSSHDETFTQEPLSEVQGPYCAGGVEGGFHPRRARLTPRGARHPDRHLAQAAP
jgi:hypothetical protein